MEEEGDRYGKLRGFRFRVMDEGEKRGGRAKEVVLHTAWACPSARDEWALRLLLLFFFFFSCGGGMPVSLDCEERDHTGGGGGGISLPFTRRGMEEENCSSGGGENDDSRRKRVSRREVELLRIPCGRGG